MEGSNAYNYRGQRVRGGRNVKMVRQGGLPLSRAIPPAHPLLSRPCIREDKKKFSHSGKRKIVGGERSSRARMPTLNCGSSFYRPS